MALDVMLTVVLQIRRELQTMKQGEERDFSPSGDWKPISVKCGPSGQFCIVDCRMPTDINIWRPLDQTACGIFWLQCKG